MNTVHFIYPHKTPVWSRPRAVGNRFFDPKLTERNQIALWCKQFFPFVWDGPIKLQVLALYSTPKKKMWGEYKITRPDLDNACLKGWMDLLEGVAYNDDAQVASCSLDKKWAEKDATHVFVSKL